VTTKNRFDPLPVSLGSTPELSGMPVMLNEPVTATGVVTTQSADSVNTPLVSEQFHSIAATSATCK